MTHGTLVSCETLARHLGSWVVVDCRYDLHDEAWGVDQYLAAHIPTAVYASLSSDLSGPATGSNGRHPLPGIERLASTLGRLGVDRTTQVVAYDQDVGAFAARLWWMLRYLGHDAAAVLDGGWARWTAERREVRAGAETARAARFIASPRADVLAGASDVEHLSKTGTGRLVDARSPERFEGRSEPLDRVAGHVPGALNRFYKDNVAPDGTMLDARALREAFERVLGGRPPRDTIMYCGSGVTACHNLLAMEHAGLSGARLYVGSWSEWSADPARAVETGPGAPRSS